MSRPGMRLVLAAFLPACALEGPEIHGYATTLQGASLEASDTVASVLAAQQRLDALWNASERIRMFAGARGRLFLGETARRAETLAPVLDRDPGLADLSFNPVAAEGAVWNASLDRLYAEYRGESMEWRTGRQRIHWGMDLFWNPCDLFNARNVLDFDYEEAPGTDAARLRFFPGGDGFWREAEAAIAADRERRVTAAARLLFNRAGYDVQWIGGSWRDEPVTGVGFAGNLGRAGWKGEAAWFTGLGADHNPALNLSSSLDYAFSGEILEGLYASGSFFFGSAASGLLDPANLAAPAPSSRNPFPSRYAVQLAAFRPVNPALACQASLLWLPQDRTALFTPSLDYAAAQRVDAQVLARLQGTWKGGKPARDLAAVYLRMRLSF